MKPFFTILAILLATAVASPASARAAPPQKPGAPVDPAGCVTAECHADVKSHRVVHGPVNVNACDACHRVVDVKKHTFELTRPQSELCSFCHQVETAGMDVVHKPVTDGLCLSCHNPHGGATGKFVRGERMDQLCNQCHADVIGNKSQVHGPAAAAACTSCHQPHAAKFPNLLMAQGRDLCFACHAEMKDQMARVKFQHQAVEQDCSSCHDAHASDFPMQVKQEPLALCTTCHEPVRQAALSASHRHSVIVEGAACLNCHTAHGGDLDKLMRNTQVNVCMKCHDQPIDRGADQRKIASVSEVLDPRLDKHGPIKDGSCGGCHDVHGSEISKLLAKEYPAPFYQGFSLEKYDLCFSCHDKQLVLTQRTAGLTNFRNGEQNLHYLHVNKTERGRNCRACHDVHASPNEMHVRTSVPYGNWEMPINFNQTSTGGSCAPGCHKPYEYDRESPVRYDLPGTTAVRPPPPAAQTPPQQRIGAPATQPVAPAPPPAPVQPPPAPKQDDPAPKPLIAPGIPQSGSTR